MLLLVLVMKHIVDYVWLLSINYCELLTKDATSVWMSLTSAFSLIYSFLKLYFFSFFFFFILLLFFFFTVKKITKHKVHCILSCRSDPFLYLHDKWMVALISLKDFSFPSPFHFGVEQGWGTMSPHAF